MSGRRDSNPPQRTTVPWGWPPLAVPDEWAVSTTCPGRLTLLAVVANRAEGTLVGDPVGVEGLAAMPADGRNLSASFLRAELTEPALVERDAHLPLLDDVDDGVGRGVAV